MPEPVFVIRNQHGFYLTRQNEWVDGHDPAPLFKTPFRDVALNTLIEVNAKDIELRGVITEVEVNDKGLPRISLADAAQDNTDTADATTEDGDENTDQQAEAERRTEEGVTSPEEDT